MRKAALLVESGEVDDGQRLALGAIERAQCAWSRDHRVLTAAHLGWALQWRHALDLGQWWDRLRQGARSSRPESDLWARLAPHDADARSDLDAYAGQMTAERREDSPWTFDLRRVNRFPLANAEYRSFHSVWRVVRLLELSGLPSGIPGVRIASEHIDRGARLVAPLVPSYAARLLLVGGSGNEKALNPVLSQTHLARMSDQDVSSLCDAAQRASDHFLGRWISGGAADDWLRRRGENAVEIMSRCVGRHGAASALDTFKWALRYRHSRRWADNPFWSCVARLWERSWEGMDLQSRADAVPEILCAPIPEDALRTDRDPGDLLHRELPEVKRADADETTWASCVRQICTALRGSEDTRSLAFDRLNWIARKHLLAEAEERDVAISLWGTVHHESDGLPHVRQVDDWVYLLLPEPEPGIAERRFRTKWIGREFKEAADSTRDGTIRNIAAAWNPDHAEERVISLSEREEAWFWSLVEEWLRNESRQRVMLGGSRDHAVSLLVEVLTHRRAPISVLHRLAENASPIQGGRIRTAKQWGSPENEYLMIAASAALGGGGSDRSGTSAAGREPGLPDERVSLAAWNALQLVDRPVRARTAGNLNWVPPSAEGVCGISVW